MHHGGGKRNETLALALEPNILVTHTGMNWQCAYLLLRTYVIVDVDD
jgi:hypothetical protein